LHICRNDAQIINPDHRYFDKRDLVSPWQVDWLVRGGWVAGHDEPLGEDEDLEDLDDGLSLYIWSPTSTGLVQMLRAEGVGLWEARDMVENARPHDSRSKWYTVLNKDGEVEAGRVPVSQQMQHSFARSREPWLPYIGAPLRVIQREERDARRQKKPYLHEASSVRAGRGRVGSRGEGRGDVKYRGDDGQEQ
jgi:hypothetical protein